MNTVAHEPVTLSPIARSNFELISAARDMAIADAPAAACIYGLSATDLSTLIQCTPSGLLEFTARLRDVPLFTLRSDLTELLVLPASTAALLAASRPNLRAAHSA